MRGVRKVLCVLALSGLIISFVAFLILGTLSTEVENEKRAKLRTETISGWTDQDHRHIADMKNILAGGYLPLGTKICYRDGHCDTVVDVYCGSIPGTTLGCKSWQYFREKSVDDLFNWEVVSIDRPGR
jgi:hypothetical protein